MYILFCLNRIDVCEDVLLWHFQDVEKGLCLRWQFTPEVDFKRLYSEMLVCSKANAFKTNLYKTISEYSY